MQVYLCYALHRWLDHEYGVHVMTSVLIIIWWRQNLPCSMPEKYGSITCATTTVVVIVYYVRLVILWTAHLAELTFHVWQFISLKSAILSFLSRSSDCWWARAPGPHFYFMTHQYIQACVQQAQLLYHGWQWDVTYDFEIYNAWFYHTVIYWGPSSYYKLPVCATITRSWSPNSDN